jgi:hypothetical protein
MDLLLDNPVWSALNSDHSHFAIRQMSAARYPSDVAPFVAIEASNPPAAAELARIVDVGETVLFVGPAPSLGSTWQLEPVAHIAQMICDRPIFVADGPSVIELKSEHGDDVRDLTTRVYPHYFRTRTLLTVSHGA